MVVVGPYAFYMVSFDLCWWVGRAEAIADENVVLYNGIHIHYAIYCVYIRVNEEIRATRLPSRSSNDWKGTRPSKSKALSVLGCV